MSLRQYIAETLGADGKYIYHGTGRGQANNIQKTGFMKTHDAGEKQPSISFSGNLDYAKYYARAKGGDRGVILRTKLNNKFIQSPRIKDNDDYEYITFDKVSSSDLEILTGNNNWQPLNKWNIIFDEPINGDLNEETKPIENIKINNNFWKWFRNSEMVKPDGTPIVFYHGTNKEFDKFDKSMISSSTDAGWLGHGFYFYTDINEARQYGKVRSFFLNIENPYYATDEDNERLAELNDIEASKEFTNDLILQGYDGVYYNGNLRGETVVFEPNQIKSIHNDGSWDINDNNIISEGKITKKVYRGGSDVGSKHHSDAIFYTDSERTALEYAEYLHDNNKIYSKIINFNNPLVLVKSELGHKELHNRLKQIIGSNYNQDDTYSFPHSLNTSERNKIIDYARKNDYDGIVMDDTDITGQNRITSYIEIDTKEQKLNEGYDDVPMEYIKNRKKLSDYKNYHDRIVIDGNTYLNFVKKEDDWYLLGSIYVFDNADETEIAKASYGKIEEISPMKATIDVRGDKRRMGIASNIYQWIEKLTGFKLHPDTPHTKSAEALWNNPNRKFGLKE